MITISGHLTKDGVVRTSKDGNTSFLAITVAVDGYTETLYFDCTYFRKGIEKMNLPKGKFVSVTGEPRQYDGNNIGLTISRIEY